MIRLKENGKMKSKNIYSFPLRRKDFTVAISDKRAHFGHLKYAVDVPISEGTKILAAKSGIVRGIKDDSKEGGYGTKYKDQKYLNYISIMHSNDEISEYAHLKHKGALVKKGQKVKEKQVIGLSGNTGPSTEPHLHFHVAKFNDSKIGWETLKIRFKERVWIRKGLVSILMWYVPNRIIKKRKK